MFQSSKQTTARQLYMGEAHTQRDIARELNVSERTVYTWIKTNGWDRLRQAARTAPVVVGDNLFSQLVELQNTIAAREEGNRFPTLQEAEVTRKLVTCIDKMKKNPSLAQNMQMLQSFRSFAHDKDDLSFCFKLNNRIERFLEGEAQNGYYPYQPEYGPSHTPKPLLAPEETEAPSPANSADKSVSETLKNMSNVVAQHTFDLTLSFGEVRGGISPETLASKASQPTSGSLTLSEEVGSVSEVDKPVLQQNADTAFLRKHFPTRLSALRGENLPPGLPAR